MSDVADFRTEPLPADWLVPALRASGRQTTDDLRGRLADIHRGYEAATPETVRALQLALVERVAASLKQEGTP